MTDVVIAANVGPKSTEVAVTGKQVDQLNARLKEAKKPGDFEGAGIVELVQKCVSNSKERHGQVAIASIQ